MSSPDCYYDAEGCLVCPDIPAVVGTPNTYEQQVIVGWNAGANTIAQHDGDVEASIPMPAGIVGCVIGLKGSRANVTTPALITHGFYFQAAGGLDVYQVIERGTVRTSVAARHASDVFVIRRVQGVITYLVNGNVVHTSTVKSSGVVLVNACLYASGDQVGS